MMCLDVCYIYIYVKHVCIIYIYIYNYMYNIYIYDCIYQWIGLRENLQETIDFPMKYVGFL